MPQSDHLPEQRTEEVELFHKELGRLGAGTLKFGGNRWAQVSFSLSEKIPAALTAGNHYDLIRAVTERGITLSLCGCQMRWLILHVDVVVEADLTESEFDAIGVEYSDFSEWFLHWQHIEGCAGEALTWTQTPQAINATVSTDTDQFDLRSQFAVSQRRQGEELILREYVEFIFTAKNRRFTIADVKAKTHELSCLLSILLAYPITTASITVSHMPGYFRRIHFPMFERPKRDQDSSFWLQCLIQQPALDGRWSTILNNFYRSQYRSVVWIRLAGMQRYEGFWEYKVLGYVSLLDSYLNIRFGGAKSATPTPPAQRKVARFRRLMSEEISTLDDATKAKIVEIAVRSFGSNEASFDERYRQAIESVNIDIAKIINLSTDDFQLIKRVRNKTAHGSDHGLKNDEFPKVIRTEAKIALLLTYWAYLDLGLTDNDFTHSLTRTLNKFSQRAEPDTVHLRRVTGGAEFFAVTPEKLLELKAIPQLRVSGCCTQDRYGELHFSAELTSLYNEWQNDLTKISGVFDPQRTFNVSEKQARFVGHGYFESGNDRLEVHHMWSVQRVVDLSVDPVGDDDSQLILKRDSSQ
jgi:hypothetical protein